VWQIDVGIPEKVLCIALTGVNMFVLEVGLAENILVLVAHGDSLHNFTIH
jgi:hypothetical protein